jgi:hypothetical protein
VKRIPAARSVPMISMSTPSRVRKSRAPPPPTWMQNSKKPQSTQGNPSECFLTSRTRFLSLISTDHHIRCSLSPLQLELEAESTA